MVNLKDIWTKSHSFDKILAGFSILLLIVGVLGIGGAFNLFFTDKDANKFSYVSLILSFALFLIQIIFGNIEVKASSQKLEEDYTALKMEIDRLVMEKGALGKLKRITEAQIWNLDGDIFGFNPNWDLELKTNFYEVHNGIRDVHYRRLEQADVDSIEYIFLEEYDYNGMYFGSEYFLKFLDELKQNHQDIDKHVHKYIIWSIPKEKWSEDISIKGIIDPFKDLIFIRGTRFEKQRIIIFFNNNTSIVNGTHSYYLELYGDNYFSQALVNMFETLKIKLCDNSCKCPYPNKSGATDCKHPSIAKCQEVYWDTVEESYKLRLRKR